MKVISYQIKLLLRDKMIIISFLLPIISALLVANLDEKLFPSESEVQFVCVKENNMIPKDLLERYGDVTYVDTVESLYIQVSDPSTEKIGIVMENKKYFVILSGDETSYIKSLAKILPFILKNDIMINYDYKIIEDNSDLFSDKRLIVSLIMIMSLFIGCSFNAINIVEEKEKNIDRVYSVIPISRSKILIQKIFLGFSGGVLMSLFTWIIMSGVNDSFLKILILIIVTSYFSSIIGVIVAKFSNNFLSVVVILKFILIMFMAIPIVILTLSKVTILYKILYFCIPSIPAFNIINNHNYISWNEYLLGIFVIVIHSIFWTFLIHSISLRSRCNI